jgi:hypothetical protein
VRPGIAGDPVRPMNKACSPPLFSASSPPGFALAAAPPPSPVALPVTATPASRAARRELGGGLKACNLYSYGFNHIELAHVPGGPWKPIDAVSTMHERDNRFQPVSANIFTTRTTTLPPAPRPDASVAASGPAAPVPGP